MVSFSAFTQIDNSSVSLKYYGRCHEKLDENDKACEIDSGPDLTEINTLSSTLGLSNYLRYHKRENTPGDHHHFLKNCSKEEADFHTDISRLALESYDISFIDRNNPSLENNRKGLPPDGYTVGKFYGNTTESCFQTGFKAALFLPTKGDHVVFAFTGTESSPTYSSGKERESYLSRKKSGLLSLVSSSGQVVSAKSKDQEDWLPVTGKKQFSNTCMKALMKDAITYATEHNKRIIFTGHSLGGALAQGVGHEVQKELLKINPNAKPLDSISFMSAGGRRLPKKILEATEARLNSVVYVSLGDTVSGIGSHVGEIRQMVRKDEYEQKFRNHELKLIDTHTFDLANFKPLEESTYITGQDMGRRFGNYSKELNRPAVIPETE